MDLQQPPLLISMIKCDHLANYPTSSPPWPSVIITSYGAHYILSQWVCYYLTDKVLKGVFIERDSHSIPPSLLSDWSILSSSHHILLQDLRPLVSRLLYLRVSPIDYIILYYHKITIAILNYKIQCDIYF